MLRAERGEPRPGEVRAFDEMEFAWIPPGEFEMGSESEEAEFDEQPVTRVQISAGYWLGRCEVTQGEWRAVMGRSSSDARSCGADCPVENVSWVEVQEFIQRMNERSQGQGLRLPTEAEWEYTARAGTTGDRYSSNLNAIAWCRRSSGGGRNPVGRKQTRSVCTTCLEMCMNGGKIGAGITQAVS